MHELSKNIAKVLAALFIVPIGLICIIVGALLTYELLKFIFG
jgi:hypothetical protein